MRVAFLESLIIPLSLLLYTVQTSVNHQLSKRPNIGFQDQLLSLNAGQKYCRMLKGEHSAMLSTFIKLPFVIKIFLSIFSGRYIVYFAKIYIPSMGMTTILVV